MRRIWFFLGCTVLLAACARTGNESLPAAAPAGAAAQPAYGNGYLTLYTFAGSDGAYPVGNLLVFKGLLYSTTQGGGAYNDGTVFAFDIARDGEQVRHSFSGGDGMKPVAGLTEYFSLLYGTTNVGGSHNKGTIFVMDHSGNLQTLHQLGRDSDGQNPKSGLWAFGGRLYGTTNYGGADGKGTAFFVTPSGRERIIHSFHFGLGGIRPDTGLISVGGKLFGVTHLGGAYGGGTVFSLTTGGSVHTLHSFGRNSDGKAPTTAALVYLGNDLYGTTCEGGTHGLGTVFRVSLTGTESVIYNFGDARHDGRCPSAGLTAVRGTFYGTTVYGGTAGVGTVFKVSQFGQERVLHSFGAGGSDGTFPEAGLTYYQDVLYGTASFGGSNGMGTVFRILP